MAATKNSKSRSGRRRYVVAMVLGTALSALGASSTANAEASLTLAHTVNDLSRYCTVCWRNARLPADSWADCTQEVFCRLLERVTPETWPRLLQDEGAERREFLRAIDTVKKRILRNRGKWTAGLPQDAVPDGRDLRERALAHDREAVRQAAGELLNRRQQKVLHLSFDGWSVQDIAKALRLPAERVSDEKYKAIRKLRGRFNPLAAQKSSFEERG